MVGVGVPLLILSILFTSAWRFRRCVETEPLLSKRWRLIKGWCQKMTTYHCILLFDSFQEVRFIIFAAVACPYERTVTNATWKRHSSKALFCYIHVWWFSGKCIYLTTCFFHKSEIWLSKLGLWSNFTLNSFSHSLFLS